MVSSLSFSLLVNAIMISLCFNSNYLYLSTYALSSSIKFLSLSISYSFYSYSYLIILCFSSSADRNYGVSSIFLPPISICEFIIFIFSSNLLFSSLSCRYSLCLISSALIAASLSYSAFLFSSSS